MASWRGSQEIKAGEVILIFEMPYMKQIISTKNAPEAIGPYSQAVRQGNFIFCSGQIALRTDGSMAPGGIKEETKQALNNLKAVLESAGASFNDVVKTTIYLTDLNNFPIVNEIYTEYFRENPPARATVGVSNLPKGALIEIDMIAAV